jgi:hypothetical protein
MNSLNIGMSKDELRERAIGYLTSQGKTDAEATRLFTAVWEAHEGQALRIATVFRKLGLARAHSSL